MHPYTSLRSLSLLSFFFLFTTLTHAQAVKENKPSIIHEKLSGAFPLVAGGKASSVYFDSNDAPVVRIAAKAFAEDLKLVTGSTASLTSTNRLNAYHIIMVGRCGAGTKE
jgi:hypothetical protein